VARPRAAQHAHRRQVLDRLLADRIVWTPRRDDGIYGYAGRLQFDGLLQGIVVTENRHKAKHATIGKVTEGGTSPMPASWNRVVPWLRATSSSVL
jgi:hypothetical protein